MVPRTQLRTYGLPVDVGHAGAASAGRRPCRAAEPLGGRPGPVARRDRRDRAPRRHRRGPGANDDASGTAALVELARAYARPADRAQQRVRAATRSSSCRPTAAPTAVSAPPASPPAPRSAAVVAVINLDAIAGHGPAAARDHGRPPALAGGAARRDRLEPHRSSRPASAPRHAGFFGQLIDLGFPFTLYEQGPFVARGVPAVTLTTAGDRPPPRSATRRAARRAQLAQIGRAAQELLGSLNQGLEAAPRGRRATSGSATASFAAGRSSWC